MVCSNSNSPLFHRESIRCHRHRLRLASSLPALGSPRSAIMIIHGPARQRGCALQVTARHRAVTIFFFSPADDSANKTIS